MRSLQRDRSTKNTCETLILVSGPTQEHVDPDLSDFVVPVQQAVVPGKGERHKTIITIEFFCCCTSLRTLSRWLTLGDCRNSIFLLFLPFLVKKVVPDSRFSDARFFQDRLFDFLQKIWNGWPANRSRSGRAARFFFVLFQIFYVFLHRVNPVGGNCR